MGLKVYLPVALLVFLAGTLGADVSARTSIAGEPVNAALKESVNWNVSPFMLAMFLLAPFIAIALVCGVVEKRARTRSAAAIFSIAMLVLLFCYFEGYQTAQVAMLDEQWTAAALSVGILPFIGLVVFLTVIGAGAIAAKFDRRTSD